jgi:hypothetical protein
VRIAFAPKTRVRVRVMNGSSAGRALRARFALPRAIAAIRKVCLATHGKSSGQKADY